MKTEDKIKQLQIELAEAKDQIERVIKDLTAKIEKLEELGDSLPKDYDEYFFLFTNGEIQKAIWFSNPDDTIRWGIGNFFKTRQEAENHVVCLKARKKLVDAIREANEGWKPNWTDDKEVKYHFRINHHGDKIEMAVVFYTQNKASDFYIHSEKAAIQIRSELGEEVIKLALTI